MKKYSIKKDNEQEDEIIVEVSEDKTEQEKKYYSLKQLRSNLESFEQQKLDVEQLIISTQELIDGIESELKKK